ncbi:MAG TPA: hypothetical protein VEA80_13725 [Vitreimonas sp.]|uniref:hypothetical protein n=1 Tax=Vitreimonas sp. TaxID=3069702 RepID=UPI002D24E4DC|nr:hypothetical protein [Vitreimonas sp.]HYD88530.1 hypothetical protein [Vitreimonas sp.]
MRLAGALTPAQAAAFWRLGLLNGDDISRLAMTWLEAGSASVNVAVLASEPRTTLWEHGALFEAALAELGAEPMMGKQQAAWHTIRSLLGAIVVGDLDPLDGAHDIIDLQRAGFGLFPPRNLAGDGRPYAGEELGIERLLGLYYELDDIDLPEKRAVEAKRELREEAGRVLEQYYTNPPSFDEGERSHD